MPQASQRFHILLIDICRIPPLGAGGKKRYKVVGVFRKISDTMAMARVLSQTIGHGQSLLAVAIHLKGRLFREYPSARNTSTLHGLLCDSSSFHP